MRSIGKYTHGTAVSWSLSMRVRAIRYVSFETDKNYYAVITGSCYSEPAALEAEIDLASLPSRNSDHAVVVGAIL